MPFCSNCGNFSIQLDSRNLCNSCSDDHFFEGKLKEKNINGAKIKTEKKLRYKMLNYIDDIELKPIVIGSNIPNTVHGQRQNPLIPNPQPIYRKSTIALILSLLGLVLLFSPFLGIFSLGSELIALSLAISSRRTEIANWRRRIAFIVCTIYILLFIISIIIMLMNPESVNEMIAALEAQGLI